MQQCAQQLKSKQLTYDVAYTSMLIRAIKSTNIILD
jgi:bisphosphoglycerate-dependent phosphoglycerate mutase